VTGNDTTTYAYDLFGNLVHVAMPDGTQIDYITDGLNRRIGKRVNGLLVQGFLYDDARVVAELDGSNQIVSRFVYGTRPNVPDYISRGSDLFRIVTDHLGSVRLVVNATTGAIAQRIDYDEFGRVTANTNPGFQPFGFAGGLTDPLHTLVRFGARDYDPETGRWTSPDAVGFLAAATNLYAYVSNSPVNLIDPTGYEAICNYYQCSGHMVCTDETGKILFTETQAGYSGRGIGFDNPAKQNLKNYNDKKAPAGPIPQGIWNITEIIDTGYYEDTKRAPVMKLSPQDPSQVFGRDGFLIHGDNATHTASSGCIIMPYDDRVKIQKAAENGKTDKKGSVHVFGCNYVDVHPE
jgi:RHS repeat-associated protein